MAVKTKLHPALGGAARSLAPFAKSVVRRYFPTIFAIM
jgi:hypothetical protein